MIQEFSVGEIVDCPYCDKEFEISVVYEGDWDDIDNYFEHLSTCDER